VYKIDCRQVRKQIFFCHDKNYSLALSALFLSGTGQGINAKHRQIQQNSCRVTTWRNAKKFKSHVQLILVYRNPVNTKSLTCGKDYDG